MQLKRDNFLQQSHFLINTQFVVKRFVKEIYTQFMKQNKNTTFCLKSIFMFLLMGVLNDFVLEHNFNIIDTHLLKTQN